MLIKTITCHEVYNHGATLQAYALMRYLTKQGHDVEIINYKPPYLSGHYQLFAINHPAWSTNIIKKAIYLLMKFPGRLLSLRRKYNFDRFTKKYLQITSQKYTSNEQLKENPPAADGYICGSDQIWNCLFANGKDPAFYLDFAPDNKRKISYAASFAIQQIPKEAMDFVKKKITKLDCISVRESSGIKILESLDIYCGTQVMDPVFLLERSEWDALCKEEFTEKYLLIYDFDKNEVITKLAIQIATERGLKIYSINNYQCHYADKNFTFAGPDIFLSLVKNAQFVISNSFHATAFSIIFRKEFLVVTRREKINTRMEDLLGSLDLKDRLIGMEMDKACIHSRINYCNVSKKMNVLIRKSKEFLQKTIHQERAPTA